MLRKTILIIKIIFILNSYDISSQTIISGIISSNQNWTISNSPYIIQSNTLVNGDVIINIEPGVIVKFNSDVQLSIRGKLIAKGTIQDTIRFIPNTVSDWNGINLDNSMSNSPKIELNFCYGSNAINFINVSHNNGEDTIIKLRNSRFDFNNSVINQNDYFKNHKVFIDSCLFTNSSYYVNAGASNNTILNSKFVNNYGCFYNSVSNQNTIIENCVFSGSANFAVSVYGLINNCNFFSNEIAISTMGLNGSIIKYNNISNNNIGIELWNYGSANSTSNINYNKICNNTINVKKIYNSDSYVPNNCWCLTDSTLIAETIIDFFDQANKGIVYFTPFDEECEYSGLYAEKKEMEDLNKSFKLFPNPTNGFVKIIINDKITNNFSVELVNYIGIQLFKQKSQNTKELILNLSDLSEGVYFIILEIENTKSKIKILKE